jgi:hypothetical protein
VKLTTVIKVSGRDRDRLLADPSFQYTGRRFAGFEGSIWGNPFRPGMSPFDAMRIMDRLVQTGHARKGSVLVIDGPFSTVDAVEWYREYVQTDRRLWDRLPELRGKTLGCWCGFWEPGQPDIGCHAVVLAQIANSLATEAQPCPSR